MQDRPDARELLDAVRMFLEEQLVPVLEGTRQFHARVAANVLGIVARELVSGEDALRSEWTRLTRLLQVPPDDSPAGGEALTAAVRALNETLAERVRHGDADDGAWHAEVLAHLRATSAERLAIANPKYVVPRREI
jgi:LmbE family N-acetylglucosaminyl deacetylase